jgi:formylglycine-generating enzyme required for sulfatase activity/serine/threonine protein kinase
MSEIPRPDRELHRRDELPLRTTALPASDTDAPNPETTPANPPSLPKQDLGEYRLLTKLGEGGMGAVYKAVHTRLDKVVALKMLSPRLEDDPQWISRFELEMKAVGRVSHPNIIQAYDAREINGVRFLVTEFVDGVHLGQLLAERGPLPIAEACEIARQAAFGLQAAHEHGLVHRDVKPSNLMLTRQGQVKLLDLGLARVQAASPTAAKATASGLIMGTADYIAPEQVTDCHGVDIRADIYSLGASLFELLTGNAPFTGKTPLEIITARLLKSPPPIRRLRAGVPETLAAVVHRMLATKPKDRYATPAAVAEALTPFAAGCDLRSLWRTEPDVQAPALTELGPKPHRTWPLMVAGVTVGLAVCGLTLWLSMVHREQPLRTVAVVRKSAPALVPPQERGRPVAEPRVTAEKRPAPASVGVRRGQEVQATWAKNLGMPVQQTNSIGMKLVLIPPGQFSMGSPTAEPRELGVSMTRESPAHRVAITRPFLLGAFEVTQAEYQQVMGSNPSFFSPQGKGRQPLADQDTARYPVESVSWADATEFCRRLSALQGEHSARRVYRLPTEAEWEYACRAGSTTRWASGDVDAELDAYAWLGSSSGNRTHPVGQKRANAWGLYDMHGNVFEWCADWFTEDYYTRSPSEDPVGPASGLERVIRGGSWWNAPAHARSAARVGAPRDGSELIGLRVACELPPRTNSYPTGPASRGSTPTPPAGR